jgi:hypothetical protein
VERMAMKKDLIGEKSEWGILKP